MKNNLPKAKLLLHSCCAPCLTSVYEQLSPFYEITVYWHNPNIWPQEEHAKRLFELTRYCDLIKTKLFIEQYEYYKENKKWRGAICGFENEHEKGLRCKKCYQIRLEKTSLTATKYQFDLFASELSVSPHKNALWLNEIGCKLEESLGVKYLPSDFKKNNGFARSVEISKRHNLYRQSYCGCEFSKNN